MAAGGEVTISVRLEACPQETGVDAYRDGEALGNALRRALLGQTILTYGPDKKPDGGAFQLTAVQLDAAWSHT